MAKRRAAHIYVLAGTNGAGKSSVAGEMLRHAGVEYFNPDKAARQIEQANPGISKEGANSAAWNQGRRLLERAIAEKLNFAFETTLGGETITAMLESAMAEGAEVKVWYVGLESVDLHIARVRSRVEQGGHDIPEEKIRERYNRSRLNLIRLLPGLAELLLIDNSAEADIAHEAWPPPELILHVTKDDAKLECDVNEVREWAKPIVTAALHLGR